MRFAYIAFLATAVVGGAHAEELTERDQAGLAERACYRHHIARLDDGVSDAATIAAVVFPNCSEEFARKVTLSAGELPPSTFQVFRERAAVHAQGVITEFVLEARAKARKKDSKR